MQRLEFLEYFASVRAASFALASRVPQEDWIPQSMTEASPIKWHLGHTTWFWEEFLLRPHFAGYLPFAADLGLVFNSYYVGAGERFPRHQRGCIVKPNLRDVLNYREYVTDAVLAWVRGLNEDEYRKHTYHLELGCAHEEQHQELMVTDIKHLYSLSPFGPRLTDSDPEVGGQRVFKPATHLYTTGVYSCGHEDKGFSFDNERPRHKVYLDTFALSPILVTNQDYMEFIADGGYTTPSLWLDEGYQWVQKENWQAPLYWSRCGGEWEYFTASGRRLVNPNEPVCHVSFYEADAYARWKHARLPTEYEWEVAVAGIEQTDGQFLESENFHPRTVRCVDGVLNDMFGKVWQWTGSAYRPYPGFRTPPGTLGEYNGKFMMNQMVLRGGSCATPRRHIRASYRNFFPPQSRWRFSGIRLVWDGIE